MKKLGKTPLIARQKRQLMTPWMVRFMTLIAAPLICNCKGSGAQPGNFAHEAKLPLYFTITGSGMGEGAVYMINQLERGTLSTPELVVGGLDFPGGMTVDGTGAIYVAEKLPAPDGKIKRITGGGAEVEVMFDGLHNPGSLAVDTFQHLYISEGDLNRISKTDAADKLISFKSEELNFPRDLAFDFNDRLFLTELDGGIVSRISPDGV